MKPEYSVIKEKCLASGLLLAYLLLDKNIIVNIHLIWKFHNFIQELYLAGFGLPVEPI